MFRQATAVGLSAALALSPSSVALAAPAAVGTLSGQVTVEGQPLSGMGLAVVDLQTGAIHRTKSDAKGNYRLELAAGEYVLTSLSVAGLAVGKAPSRVVVSAGRVAVASLDLLRLPVLYTVQDPPAPAVAGPETFGNITHEKVSCLVAGQFPLIEAVIEPAASVARARVYFKSALGTDYYFVEMTLQDGKFVGKLPKPKLEASPITYYIQATTTEFGESQTPEIETTVVADESECEGKVAPIGPAGAVTVFSASTAAVAVPVGFAAGGLALGAGGLALAGGLLAAGGVAAAAGGGGSSPSPSPAPSVAPSVAPSPSPSPSPSPAPSPSPLPNCTYNETTGDPTNCPCAPAPFTPATTITGQPTTPRTCADIGK